MFTFKREPRGTGLASVANPYPAVEIKIKKKAVGQICPPSIHSEVQKWRIRFTVKDDKSTCGWKWITLTKLCETEEEAREWLKVHSEQIEQNFQLHTIDD